VSLILLHILRSIVLVEVYSVEIPVFPSAFYSVLNASLFFHVQMFLLQFLTFSVLGVSSVTVKGIETSHF